MSGISYDPPLEQLAIFDPSVFIYDQNLSSTTSGGTFLNFPIAQGTETFIDLISNGTATLNTATVSNTLNITDTLGYNTLLNAEKVYLTFATSSASLEFDKLTISSGLDTNTLNASSWSGNIASVNTTANLTHYLGFFDSSATGSGKPQKVASLSCNPSTA